MTNKKVEEKVVSGEKKQELEKQATDEGKVVLDHPQVQYLPYPHAPSKKDKERQYKRFLDIFKQLQKTQFTKAMVEGKLTSVKGNRTIHEPFSIRGNISSSNTEIHISKNLNHLQQAPTLVRAINLQQHTRKIGHTKEKRTL